MVIDPVEEAINVLRVHNYRAPHESSWGAYKRCAEALVARLRAIMLADALEAPPTGPWAYAWCPGQFTVWRPGFPDVYAFEHEEQARAVTNALNVVAAQLERNTP